MRISAVDLYLLELPLREPFVASHGGTETRTITAIKVRTDQGFGWGECSALPAATYSAESAPDSFRALGDELAPRLLGQDADHRAVAGLRHGSPGRPMAVSGLEMAVLDLELRRAGRSLAHWLGVSAPTVPAGASIGMAAVEQTVAKAVELAAEGYRRLKVKIQPGHDLELVTAVRRALPSVELHVDANGAYCIDDLDLMLGLVDRGVDAIEQPFPPSAETAAAVLIDRLATGRGRNAEPVPVVADEAVASLDEAVGLIERKAMTALSIKPARVGGLVAARALHELCLARRLPATAGGMLETGLGRHALAALAGLPGFTLPGDLSPAGRWLTIDPWPDLQMTDGRITVPRGPGIAPDPDDRVLTETTIEHRTVA